MASKSARGNVLSFRRMRKRFRLVPFLTFFFLKALCSLVMINFYMGSQISIHQLEDSFSMMMRQGGSREGPASLKSRDSASVESNRMIESIVKEIVDDIASNNLPNTAQIDLDDGMIVPNFSDGTVQGKERLWEILQTRNVTQVDAEYWASIPTWSTILKNIHLDVGSNAAAPIIHGLETCESFRNITSSDKTKRRIAPAGLFNTGTNYLSVLLEYNCQNPHRVKKFNNNTKRAHGNEWEVPWGKHSPPSARGRHFKNKHLKYTVDDVLPIVLVRNPYGWMKSMCRNPYTAKWKGIREKTCPRLKTNDGYNHVDVRYGSGTTHHLSLGHLWNDWYGEYFYSNRTDGGDRTAEAPFPRLMIRFEDIIFFPREVTVEICKCAGGVIGHRRDDKDVTEGTFHYVVRSAKAGFGHGPAERRNGLIDSWARYGGADPRDAYSKEEVRIAEEILDPLMLDVFRYG